jgi:hypothetical protein
MVFIIFRSSFPGLLFSAYREDVFSKPSAVICGNKIIPFVSVVTEQFAKEEMHMPQRSNYAPP